MGAARQVSARADPTRRDVLETTDVGNSTNIRWHETMVQREDKEMLLGQKGCVLWFTGLSASGKSTVACTLEHILSERGHYTILLDGDNIRHGLNSDLGFSAEQRAENIRRIGEVAKVMAENGAITLTSFISPYLADRALVRDRLAPGDFLEIYMRAPLALCESRDPKGLYAKARAGKLRGFTGVDDPYEEPVAAELVIDALAEDGAPASPEALAHEVLAYLDSHGYLRDPRLGALRGATAASARRRAAEGAGAARAPPTAEELAALRYL